MIEGNVKITKCCKYRKYVVEKSIIFSEHQLWKKPKTKVMAINNGESYQRREIHHFERIYCKSFNIYWVNMIDL